MKKRAIITSILFLIVSLLVAQNEVDALRYSHLTVGGTARYVGLAGAFGAVGADLTVMSTNPGALGLFKTSEFEFSMNYFNRKTESNYYNGFGSDFRGNFNIPTLGFVYTMDVGRRPGEREWKFVQLGFGMVRNNNFYSRTLINGTNPDNSLLDAYVDMSNGLTPDELDLFSTDLAYQTYLMDPIPNTLFWTNRAPLYPDESIAPVDQRKSISTWGYMNEFDFTISADWADILYIGGSFGIPVIRYTEESLYEEFNTVSSDTNTFNSFSKADYLYTSSSGVNFKLGAVVRIADWVRLGFAYNSPSWFNNMYDDYYSTMYSNLNNGRQYSWDSPSGAYNYRLQTPQKFIGSIAFIFSKYGLISADYEYIDYSKAILKGSDYGFSEENAAINSNYASTSNIRVGTEWRYSNYSFRGGYAHYGNPFVDGINDATQQIVSAGIGYRIKYFYMDFAYSRSSKSEDYYMYESENVFSEPAKIDAWTNSFLLTFGFKY